MKFNNYIKTEINQREITPSHDAFDRIQSRLSNQEKSDESFNKFKYLAIVAVVIGLLVSVTFYFNQANNPQTTIITQQIKEDRVLPQKESGSSSSKGLAIVNQSVLIAQQEKKIATKPTKYVEPSTNKNSINRQVETINIEEKLVREPVIENSKNTEVLANLDTLKMKNKRKQNYTDPNMLLYSIENKEALKETNNQKTKVAVIDLNK